MNFEDDLQPAAASRCMSALQECRRILTNLFPAVEKRLLDDRCMPPSDALFVDHFLDNLPGKTTALEVGSFAGTSAFCLAAHPAVSTVLSVVPDSPLAEEFPGEHPMDELQRELLQELRVADVARALAERVGSGKVRFVKGGGIDTLGGELSGEMVEVRNYLRALPETSGPLALIGGLRTREGTAERLRSLFLQHPRAVALVGSCRYGTGPRVQAGIVDFVDAAGERRHFQLVGDLSPGLSTSGLGLVYSEGDAQEISAAAREAARMFSGRLDPLRLLRQEEELVETVNDAHRDLRQARTTASDLRRRVSEMELELEEEQRNRERLSEGHREASTQASQLETRNARLLAHYSSRRYRLVDTVAQQLSKIPGLRGGRRG